MTDHLPECWLAEPCRSRNDGHENHDLLTTIAGVPAAVCEVCLDTCICHNVRSAYRRGIQVGISMAEDMVQENFSKYSLTGETPANISQGFSAIRSLKEKP